MSCNGCRVLRKGCSDSCALRPCLQWIEGAEAQGHATVFVAKFFGRAGLMGFINAVPENQRPALFRSLLYEACGRTVNPVYGAVGLLWSGNWHVCQAAVDNVLRGGSLKPPGPPAAVPCYGPMPNLPRVHFPISQGKSDHPATMEDLKRVKLEQPPLKSYVQHHEENAATAAGGFVSLAGDVKPSVVAQQKSVFFDQQTEYYRRNGAASDRQQIQKQGVKKEREEMPEVIVPIARRARLRLDEDSNYCCLGSSKAAPPETMVVNEEEIDLDLTLSSHPPTPQLLPRPPQQGGGGGGGGRRVPSPLLSCSNSMSSEGSVTSLDTGDFTAASRNGSCSMDFLRQMENKQQQQQQQLQLPKS